jgi:hypothetical protein
MSAALTHFIVMSMAPGYWGRGDTIRDAIRKAKYLTRGTPVRVIKVDAEAYVDELGMLCYHARKVIGIGHISYDGKGVARLRPETQPSSRNRK